MSAAIEKRLMDGRAAAARILGAAAARLRAIVNETAVVPSLATVIIGDDEASAAYVRVKSRRCDEVGVRSTVIALPESTRTEEAARRVRELAADASVHAILVQHPVPKPIDKRAVFEAIPIEKDVDAVSSAALGRVILGMPCFASCTPVGIMRLLREYEVELDGAHAVVIGRSPILGRPMASMLINAHATVTLCHSRTRNLERIIGQADLLIAAVGKPRFVHGKWIKRGAVVIDAGYNPGPVGDVDFDSAVRKASLITPVPGGVGPMTIATLISHTVEAARRQLGAVEGSEFGA